MGNDYSKLRISLVEKLLVDHLDDVYIYIAPDIEWAPCVGDIMVYYRRLSDRAKDDFYSGYISNQDYSLATLVFHAVHNLIVELLGKGDPMRFPYWQDFNWKWDSKYAKVYHKKVHLTKSNIDW